MARKPGLFRSPLDALLSIGLLLALIGWIVAGLLIFAASLRPGGL